MMLALLLQRRFEAFFAVRCWVSWQVVYRITVSQEDTGGPAD